jgi:hypothetical protein
MNKINFVKKSIDWSLTTELSSAKVLVAEEPICQVSTLKLLQFCMVMGVINHSRRREHVEKHHIGAENRGKLNSRRREKMNSGDTGNSKN